MLIIIFIGSHGKIYAQVPADTLFNKLDSLSKKAIAQATR